MKGWMGLCLALTLVCVGCMEPQSVAFSPDGKLIAQAIPKHGFVIRSVADNKVVTRYETGGAWALSWSPSGHFLAFSSIPLYLQDAKTSPKTTILDVAANKLSSVSIPMAGPFVWSKDENILTGFDAPPNDAEGNAAPVSEIQYNVQTKTSDARVVGPYLPFGVYPGTQDFALLSKNSILKLHEKQLTEAWNFAGNGAWQPTGFALRPNGTVVVCEMSILKNKVENRASAPHERLSLPASIATSMLRDNSVSLLVGVSPDLRWLFVEKLKDESLHKVLGAALLASAPDKKDQTAASNRYTALRAKERITFTFLVIDAKSGSGRALGSMPGNTEFRTLVETAQSPDGRWLTLSSETGYHQSAWLFDTVTGKSSALLNHEGGGA